MTLLKKILKSIIICILLFILFVIGFNRFYVHLQQKYYNNKQLKNKSQYTIMCLGESTTAGQYPIQLQQILNEKYPNKFSVIDCGIHSITLDNILALLDNNIKKYNPNIAICMMGGDSVIDLNYKSKLHIKKSKFLILKNFLKMFVLFKNNIKDLFSNNLFADTQNQQNLLNLAIRLHNQYKIKESSILLEKSLEVLKKDSADYQKAYTYLLINYSRMKEDKYNNIAYKMAVNALKQNYYDKTNYYLVALKYLSNNDKKEELKPVITLLIKEKDYVPTIDVYNMAKPHLTNFEDKILLNKMVLARQSDNYHIVAMQYLKDKNYQKAEEYFSKAEELRINYPNVKLYDLYKKVVKKLIDNNIKVICMQYPIRSVASIQEQLKNEPYYNKITFISNEKLFKNALMEKNYFEIFRDLCSQDFGHCTNLGNTMIAENVVSTLENILDLK